ncbi:c-type cytochrome [Aureibacter tunicatorum]|uniref:Mono/diheme cytochrome c family protein n=1 Tax=Aureibacter tunicatorum TaxID=866807 RepID=A0AAE4BSS0_9BACT|nr:cytochrome c [Aureibacter tunicatorum]MDR6239113.1 mono/diheme cytochrome c family protein [Aureibacter tunicatorum]BDD04961.1 hypothetical protein AUTU_24440 [Aureibacter tunicatorum]
MDMKLKMNVIPLFLLILFCFASCGGSNSPVKLKQYMVNGQRGYEANCANCHMSDGSGLGKVIPPLKGADFLDKHLDQVICGIKYGMDGKIIVNGVEYDQPMPGSKFLSDIEIAEIVTFITNTWGNGNGIVTIEQVQGQLKKCNN